MIGKAKHRMSWVFLLATAAATLSPAALAGNSVLRLKFSGPVAESPSPDGELMALLGGDVPTTLREWVHKIDKAAKDDEIVGIAMILDQPAVGFAQIQELRQALERFRATGKKVYCYMDHAGNGGFALAVGADHITLAEYSELAISGLRAELSFYKGLLDKIGVKADMLHCGAFKSALEPYTRTEPSAEAAENINWLLDGIFDAWISMIADGRGLGADQIRDAVDHAPINADKALSARLIDAIDDFDGFSQRLRKEFGQDVEIVKKYPRKKGDKFELDPSNPFAFFTQMNQMMEELFGTGDESDEPGIGLIYIEGMIVMGDSQQSPFGGATAGSTTVRAAFDAALEDDNVKAVVLRVNSPGGSALASDIMWKAAMRLAEKKPLIVSMGGVAGSGGYYVALPGDVIFADETTITGSIGVVGGKMVWNGLFEGKLGITTTEFTRGANAALMSANSAWTEQERETVQGWLNDVYDQFKGRVMSTRGDKLTMDLETLAQGKVYTGKQALGFGLVDKLGSLSDAINHAADRANLDDPKVYTFPKKKDFAQVLAQLMGEETDDDWDLTIGRALAGDPLMRAFAPFARALAPDKVHALIRDFQKLAILNREHVGCFMPLEPGIR